MDFRRDPGEYYPGGRVIARGDTAPGQVVVKWSDIQGKPDFSDLAPLPERFNDDDTREKVNTMITKLKTAAVVLAFGLCAAYSADARLTVLSAPKGKVYNDEPVVTNVTGAVGTAEVEIPAAAAERGVTFRHSSGEDQNAAVEIGHGAQSAVSGDALNAAPSNTVARSVGVAIGPDAVVTDDAKPHSVQGVAIGWHAQSRASNAIAIGGGAQHPGETVETGNAAVASGSTSIAVGYDAKATASGAIAVGRSAKARAENAVQLGQGVNAEANTLKYRDTTIVRNGRVCVDEPGIVRAAEEHMLTNKFARMSFYEDAEKKVMTFSAEDGANDTDYTHQIVLMKNADSDEPIPITADAKVYRSTTVDRRIAAATNGLSRVRESTEYPGSAAVADFAVNAERAEFADCAFGIEDNRTDKGYRDAADIFAQLDAATSYFDYFTATNINGHAVKATYRNTGGRRWVLELPEGVNPNPFLVATYLEFYESDGSWRMGWNKEALDDGPFIDRSAGWFTDEVVIKAVSDGRIMTTLTRHTGAATFSDLVYLLKCIKEGR